MTDHNDYLARRAAIVGKQQRSVLERLGLTDPGLTADERAARHDLRQLNAEEAKQLASTRDYGPRARSALVGVPATWPRPAAPSTASPTPWVRPASRPTAR